MFNKKRSSKPTFINRAFRSVVSIIVLTAFVLGISFFVKEIASLDTSRLISLSSPLLSKLGISEETVGDVAGAFASRVLNINIAASKPVTSIDEPSIKKQQVFKVAVMSDSEDDNATLQRALFEASNEDVDAVFHLGDLTQLGTAESFEEVKKVLDNGSLVYYTLPGDHDLYKSVGTEGFEQVFGKTSQLVTLKNTKFILLDNSANYTLIGDEQMSWFKEKLADADFVLLSQPIYHPSPSVIAPVMGMINGDKDPKVYEQRGALLKMIQDSDVKAIFAGDHHRSSNYPDALDKGLTHYAIGAINESKLIQSSRFSILTIYNTGEYEVSEILLD